jgi:hypothetical protein
MSTRNPLLSGLLDNELTAEEYVQAPIPQNPVEPRIESRQVVEARQAAESACERFLTGFRRIVGVTDQCECVPEGLAPILLHQIVEPHRVPKSDAEFYRVGLVHRWNPSGRPGSFPLYLTNKQFAPENIQFLSRLD